MTDSDIHTLVRAALSARLDGEPAPAGIGDDTVDAHLSACPQCREWFVGASDLNRRLRMSVADSRPAGDTGGDAQALAASMVRLADETPKLSHGLRNRSLPLVLSRLAMAAIAVCYIAWSVWLLSGAVGGADPAEGGGPGGAVANAGDPDLASLSVDAATVRFALAAGLLWGAARPRSAPGLLPVFLAMWGFGAGFATRDIVLGIMDGALDVGAVAGLLLHLAACIALVSVWLSRHHAVTPLRQSLRGLSARPVSYSPDDARANSSWRPGDGR